MLMLVVSYNVERSFVDVVMLEGETPVKTASEIVEGFELPNCFSSVGLVEDLDFLNGRVCDEVSGVALPCALFLFGFLSCPP